MLVGSAWRRLMKRLGRSEQLEGDYSNTCNGMGGLAASDYIDADVWTLAMSRLPVFHISDSRPGRKGE